MWLAHITELKSTSILGRVVCALWLIVIGVSSFAGAGQLNGDISADQAASELERDVRAEFDRLVSLRKGIFHNDITPVVSKFFPVGMPLSSVNEILSVAKIDKLEQHRCYWSSEANKYHQCFKIPWCIAQEGWLGCGVYAEINFEFVARSATMVLIDVSAYMIAKYL
jgi:hypothetical protein